MRELTKKVIEDLDKCTKEELDRNWNENLAKMEHVGPIANDFLNERAKTLVDELKDYFENTPQEQLDKDWKEIEEKCGNIGPTVDEYLGIYSKKQIIIMKTVWYIGLVVTFIPIILLEIFNVPIAAVRYCFGNKTIFQRTPMHVWKDLWLSAKEM